ncbi:HTH-type transcriptional repressor CytR [Marinomonas spartinae]|uniref:HTH-type transcriptional repressor CytR n=1 Tax=Marinomonas spartinae TaxID=1792290 RepID=A0A1A8TFG2_9GAMM|nr:substrate-binding domain-containing protein [Marinomonas spartinae]SBS31262.1 HTH-type transcriptional repressor CytR [Marinomonas spartinae]
MSVKNIANATQVAKLAGVSRSAVSRTFTPGASVSAATRERVLKAAKELNYHVNHLARGLSHERSRPVCILGADLKAPYQASLLNAITKRLQEVGRAVMVINSFGDQESSEAAIRQTLNYRASATIVLSGTPPASLIETCLQAGQHVILVNREGQFEGPDHITVNVQSSIIKAHQLMSEAGCQNFAVVSSTIQSPSLVKRENVFIQATKDSGQACELRRDGPTSYETGAKSARQLLSRETPIDAVFCVTDLIACGFMDVARHEFGLRIPEDLCILGFDNIEQAGWYGYQLTTFSQPLSEIADAISELLESALDNHRKAETRAFDAPLTWRNSIRHRKSTHS